MLVCVQVQWVMLSHWSRVLGEETTVSRPATQTQVLVIHGA